MVALVTIMLAVLPVARVDAVGFPTIRGSVNSAQEQGNTPSAEAANTTEGPYKNLPYHASSFQPSLSLDGRYVAFVSNAVNMDVTRPDPSDTHDVFVRDMVMMTTVQASLFSSDIVIRVGPRPVPGPTVILSNPNQQGKGPSVAPSISGDGRYVAFESDAANSPSQTNDIWVRDLATQTTTRVSLADNGSSPTQDSARPSISSDGRYVAFESLAPNLTSDSDTNETWDIFLRDRDTDGDGVFDESGASSTTLMSVCDCDFASAGNAASIEPAISADGQHVAFSSLASDLRLGDMRSGFTDIFVRDVALAGTSLITTGFAAGDTSDPSLSADGSIVAFESDAALLETDQNRFTDVYVSTATSLQLPVTSLNGRSYDPELSDDGQKLAFTSEANDLVSNDVNKTIADIFSYDFATELTALQSVDSSGGQGPFPSVAPAISGNGLAIGFISLNAFAPDDTNQAVDVYVHIDQSECPAGRKRGTVSEPIHRGVEPLSGNAEVLLNRTNCEQIARRGL